MRVLHPHRASLCVLVRTFRAFYKLCHSATTGTPKVEAFLAHLSAEEQVSASTQNQALAALPFLYQEVLAIPFGDLYTRRGKKTTYIQPYLES
ncbi:MAG: phage integrase N-terminal SAM-like domain-containing protein [Candidatus Methanomethyliaceae archaeon]